MFTKQDKADLIKMTATGCAYNAERKAEWERLGDKLLRHVVKKLGLSGGYDLRYNAAGIACSGDHTLHTDDVYVSFNADRICDWILVRTVKGREDYTGGINQNFPYARLAEKDGVGKLVEFIAGVQSQGKALRMLRDRTVKESA